MPAAPRFFCAEPLLPGTTIALSEGAARHVQVLRLQPGDGITLFAGTAHAGTVAAGNPATDISAGEFDATIAEIGRRIVRVIVGRHHPVDREPARELHLAIGMPANERMDWLVEKATELGAAVIQPLMTERSVVRLDEARARKKTSHWTSIAIAACEQCGRNRVPLVRDVLSFAAWSRQPDVTDASASIRFVLSLGPGAIPLRQAIEERPEAGTPFILLSGPEGGLSRAEEEAALRLGFQPVSLGTRVLRAETAALAALTLLG